MGEAIMSTLPMQQAAQLPLVHTINLTDEEREQLHTNAKYLQQLLCTRAVRSTFGNDECEFMLMTLDMCLRSCTPVQADADLKEVVERITRIVK